MLPKNSRQGSRISARKAEEMLPMDSVRRRNFNPPRQNPFKINQACQVKSPSVQETIKSRCRSNRTPCTNRSHNFRSRIVIKDRSMVTFFRNLNQALWHAHPSTLPLQTRPIWFPTLRTRMRFARPTKYFTIAKFNSPALLV